MSDQQTEQAAPPPEPELKEPSYFEQFSRDFRQSPIAKKLYKYPKAELIAKALVEVEEKLERAVIVPKAEAPDPTEAKAYREKMQLPEKPEEYDIPAEKGREAIVAEFQKFAAAAGLTKPQAKKVYELIMGAQKAQEAQRAEAQTKEAESFAKSMLAAAGGDEEKAKSMTEFYRATLAARLGKKSLIQKLADRGLLQDPEFAESIMELGRLLEDDHNVEGEVGGKGPGKPKPVGTMGNYSSEWEKATKEGIR